MFARPGPIVDGARQRRGLLSQFCIILRLTEPFDEVVLGKSQAITPLSERLKVDFALIDQNIANQILWLVSHAPLSLFMVFSMSRNSRQGALPVLRRRYRTAYI